MKCEALDKAGSFESVTRVAYDKQAEHSKVHVDARRLQLERPAPHAGQRGRKTLKQNPDFTITHDCPGSRGFFLECRD